MSESLIYITASPILFLILAKISGNDEHMHWWAATAEEKGIGNGAVHVMLLIEVLRKDIRVSVLKLPRPPGNLLCLIVSNACFSRTPPTHKQMPPDGEYHLETKKILS